jgi:hypothetical protein
MTFEEFKKDIENGINELPSNWRYGQKVFNYIDSQYGVARTVQFVDGVDCFYNDDIVDAFVIRSYEHIVRQNAKKQAE